MCCPSPSWEKVASAEQSEPERGNWHFYAPHLACFVPGGLSGTAGGYPINPAANHKMGKYCRGIGVIAHCSPPRFRHRSRARPLGELGAGMSDITAAPASATGGIKLPGFGDIGALMKRGDIALAVGVLTILVVLILPLPPILLDLALAISIIISVLILMTALFIHTPLEFSSFPTVLLIATMLRLALNLASTRLILAHGHEGTDAAGHVIEAFGNFVMSGNFVIGIIVFTILVIVNFVVITKGSGRIAEVAARFHLDAMPGKQMAIDADLSAGLIDEKEARARRQQLEDEGGFFGAMDGASKFVRGDAIAGLLVVFINVIGGMIIGIAQQGLSFADAAHSYTMLTVGDGLVTQVPALIVSTAAGLLVSKAGVAGAADKALLQAALRLSAGARHVGRGDDGHGAAARHPDAAVHGARRRRRRARLRLRQARAQSPTPRRRRKPMPRPRPRPRTSRSRTALKIDDLKVELGYALLPLVNAPDGSDRLTEQIKALRRSLAAEMGFVMPAVRILDNVQLDANGYVIKIKEVDAGTRQGLAGPIHGHGPGRRSGEPAWHPHHRADLRPAGDLDRRRRSKKKPRSRATPSSMRRR